MSLMTASYYPSVNTFMWPSNDGGYHDYSPRPSSFHQQLRSTDERMGRIYGSRTPGSGRQYEESIEEQELRMRLIMMVNDLTEDIDEDMMFSKQQEKSEIYATLGKPPSEAVTAAKSSRPKRVRTKRPQRMKALAAASRTEGRQHTIPPTKARS